MRIVDRIQEVCAWRDNLPGSVGLAPTMGALHAGHLALASRARAENDHVVASIFVNPAQFGPQEDYATYPRDLDRDLDLLRAEGADLVFAPSPEELYSQGFDTWVEPGAVASRLEGEHRPGHFRGVATVVLKLLNIVRPDRAYFGQKDGQQVAVLRRLVADLHLPVQLVAVPTVRDPDGLALSSRNVLLIPSQRRAAPVIYAALYRARTLWEGGERSGDMLRAVIMALLKAEPHVDSIDYVSVADPESMRELKEVRGPAMVSVAVHMGTVRLIDNVLLE